MRQAVAFGFLTFNLVGCAAPPEAPTDFDGLAAYLYREWGQEDPAAIQAGLNNLSDFLFDVDVSASKVLDRSWQLSALQESDVEGVPRPDRDLSALVGVGVAGASEHHVLEHAQAQVWEDQTPLEPTANFYERTFPDADASPDCFLSRDCEFLVTENQATRQNLLMTVDFELFKTFRWVALDEEGSRYGLISRSWFADSFEGKNGKTALYQSFSTDVWIEQEDGSTVRLQMVWSESDVGIAASEGTVQSIVKRATDDIFKRSDEAIEEAVEAGDIDAY